MIIKLTHIHYIYQVGKIHACMNTPFFYLATIHTVLSVWAYQLMCWWEGQPVTVANVPSWSWLFVKPAQIMNGNLKCNIPTYTSPHRKWSIMMHFLCCVPHFVSGNLVSLGNNTDPPLTNNLHEHWSAGCRYNYTSRIPAASWMSYLMPWLVLYSFADNPPIAVSPAMHALYGADSWGLVQS